MKSEHEKLKEIADVIGYRIDKNISFISGEFIKEIYLHSIKVNVREIIFTQEFMDLLKNHIEDTPYFDERQFYHSLFENLDTPVEFIYKTLNLGKQDK